MTARSALEVALVATHQLERLGIPYAIVGSVACTDPLRPVRGRAGNSCSA